MNAVVSAYLYSKSTTELQPLNGGIRGSQISDATQVKIAMIINNNNTLNINILLIALNSGALQLVTFHTAAKIISIPYRELQIMHRMRSTRSRSVRF